MVPIFTYNADGYRVESAGNYNLPYKVGDSVLIRYNPSELTEFKIDNTWHLWKDIFYWSILPFLFITMIFFIGDTIPNKIRVKFKFT